MKQSKARGHGNCIEYNGYCTVNYICTVVLYIYILRLKSPWRMSLYQSYSLSYSFLSVPPTVTSYSDNQTVKEGINLTLFCNSTGKPTPNITWTKVSEDEVLFVGNPWRIVNINRTYSGTYRCNADNGVPSPVSSTISINVLCKYTLCYHLHVSLILFRFA